MFEIESAGVMKMRTIAVFILMFVAAAVATAQNEQSPIVERNFAYLDWTLPNLDGSGRTNLRTFAQGKKLVMVVYWAPWCHNWEHDRDFVQSLFEKYKNNGFAVIGVGEYDSVSKMRDHVKSFKLTFPFVYESDNSADREKTVHFSQRREAGDMRKWGSPWYVFLEPGKMTKSGEILSQPVFVVNGELIREEAEKFIREKLGLAADGSAAARAKTNDVVEPCKETVSPMVTKIKP
ncbi:MAG: peroxiredoxin family protein [Pyrinomonadaceae bacterium]|jgi:peroxiredoxin